MTMFVIKDSINIAWLGTLINSYWGKYCSTLFHSTSKFSDPTPMLKEDLQKDEIYGT